MKIRIIFIFATLILGTGCSKSDDENGNNPDKPNKPSPLPDLPDPNDVCSCMDDIIFMQYCYDNFDVNKDGKVSKIEASAVAKIDLARQEIKTLTGIGYFSNLEIINCNECYELTSVNLSNNSKITSIGYAAFSGCSCLTDITIPASVTLIGSRAFSGCSSLTAINIPDNVTEIGNGAFSSCSSLMSINIPKKVTELNDLFTNCSSLRNVTFEKGSQLKYIFGVYGMFYDCEALTSIEIPASVEMIKGCIFKNCTSLRNVTFEKGSQLKYIVGGSHGSSYSVFYDCEALTSIEIPASVEMIDDMCYNCINLANIYCYPSTPPILDYLSCENFVLYVPSQSIEAYKNSSWSKYYSSIKAIE